MSNNIAYSPAFLSAEQIFKNPFTSTDEEKLKAIELLKSVATKESMELLTSALHMISLPITSKNKPSANQELDLYPKGGIVTAKASQALYHLGLLQAVRTVEDLALDRTQHEYLREAIVYGLAESDLARVAQIFLATLYDPSALVRARTVRSIYTFVKNIKHVNSFETERLLGALTEKVLEFDDDLLPLPPKAWQEAFEILSRNLPASSRTLLSDVIIADHEPGRILAAIELLAKFDTKEVNQAIVTVLEKPFQTESIYRACYHALKGKKFLLRPHRNSIKNILWMITSYIVPSFKQAKKVQTKAINELVIT